MEKFWTAKEENQHQHQEVRTEFRRVQKTYKAEKGRTVGAEKRVKAAAHWRERRVDTRGEQYAPFGGCLSVQSTYCALTVGPALTVWARRTEGRALASAAAWSRRDAQADVPMRSENG